MWSLVAQRLIQITPPAATLDQLWQRGEAAWSAVPQERIQSLFESMPRRVAVLQKGDDVTIPCKGSMAPALDNQYPNAEVSWLLNGKPIYVDDKKKILKDNQDLLIKNVTHEDSGVVTCVVKIDKRTSVTVSLSTVSVQNDVPDLKVEVGYSFYLLCNGIILSRIFPSKLLQKWYHNSTLYKELKDSSPRDENELYFKTSNYSDSGVWLCRIAELGGRSRWSSREWVTNVITVQVMPPKTLIKKLIPYTIGVAVGLVLILLISLIYYIKSKLALRREIKAKTKKKKSDKTSKSSKESKSKKKSKVETKKDSKKSKGKSGKDSKKSKGKSDKGSKKSKGKKKSHKRHGDSKSSKAKKKLKDKKK
ncbi:uncharacterized protein TNCV_4495691 [Trichonephila clavipes]|nr:uncharacterized protein TNCV_4495691 [Trichonephila clavipes]